MKTRNFYTSEHLGQYSSIKEIGRKIHNTKPFQQLIIKLSIFLLLYLLKLKLLSNADKASGNWKHQEPHITDKKINKWCSHKQHLNSVFKLKFKSYKNLRCEVSKIIFKVVYTADSLQLDLLSLTKEGSGLMTSLGSVEWLCKEIKTSLPLHYRSSNSYHSNKLVRKWITGSRKLKEILFFRVTI